MEQVNLDTKPCKNTVSLIYSSVEFLFLLSSIIEHTQKLTVHLLATKTHKLITSGDLYCCQNYKKNKYAYNFVSTTCKYISVFMVQGLLITYKVCDSNLSRHKSQISQGQNQSCITSNLQSVHFFPICKSSLKYFSMPALMKQVHVSNHKQQKIYFTEVLAIPMVNLLKIFLCYIAF